MRRWYAVGTLAGTMLALVAGCADGTGTPVGGGAVSTPAVAAPTPTAAPSSPDPGTAADTHRVCDAINQAVAQGASAFGTDLGSMVGHLAGNNRAAAETAKQSALHRLSALAATVRSAAAPAVDPVVRAAAENTAGNLDRVAADPGLLTGVKTVMDMSPVLGRITSAADPLTNVCA